MRTERFAGISDLAADRAALAARAHHPVADDADVRNPVGVVERVNAYRMDTKMVPFCIGGHYPAAHAPSVTRDEVRYWPL